MHLINVRKDMKIEFVYDSRGLNNEVEVTGLRSFLINIRELCPSNNILRNHFKTKLLNCILCFSVPRSLIFCFT